LRLRGPESRLVTYLSKAGRVVAVIPVTWFLARTTATSIRELMNLVNVVAGPLQIAQVLVTAIISVVGLMGALFAMMGNPVGLATAYVAYVIMACSGAPPSLTLTVFVVLGFITYLLLDVVSGVWRPSRVRAEVSARGALFFLVFEAVKVGLPVILAWFIYGFYVSLLRVGFTPSPGLSMLWDVFAHTLVGRLFVFVFVIGLGAYLSSAVMDILTSYATPNPVRVRSYAEEWLRSLKSFLVIGGFPSKFVVGWMAFMGSILFYPFIMIPLREAIDRYLGGMITSLSIPVAIINAGVGIAVLVVSYIVMRLLLTHILLAGGRGWVSLAVVTTITFVISAYLVAFKGVPPPWVAGSASPTSIDKTISESYYSFYSSLLTILRYVLYLLGVTP